MWLALQTTKVAIYTALCLQGRTAWHLRSRIENKDRKVETMQSMTIRREEQGACGPPSVHLLSLGHFELYLGYVHMYKSRRLVGGR
ncbi:hypothetical protein IWX90DRAFT_246072 [Phyllosticta citrichinensis]|uniref:Secreted protein n=1 Tax=Phyllosticta citrichinensis TaxID=1130410 RepID=A0ABR1XQU4_9PEZI